jgi:cysteine-rich repeat protein
VCGDGHTNAAAGEGCDDGNFDNTDACTEVAGVCSVAGCGDGHVQVGVEGCDDGNGDNTDDCPDGIGGTCEPSFCGDGFTHAVNEACDDANLIENDTCTNACEAPSCGDGILQAGEACDDGNLVNGDGCDDACAESDDVLWIDITGGVYSRGDVSDLSARPVLNVTIGDLRVLRTEVTVKQYQECIDANVCSIPEPGRYCNYGVAGRDWHPINCVTQEQAITYAAFRDALDPTIHIRLPSEAEWEFIARSEGVANRYPWGGDDVTCDHAMIRSGGYGCGLVRTAPVCSTSTTDTPRLAVIPNGDTDQAVCDMAGNVSEWTLDIYTQTYNVSFKDARPFQGGLNEDEILKQRLTDLRVIRGGAWAQRVQYLTTTSRSWLNRYTANVNLGIRLVASLCGNGVIEGAEVCDDGNHDIFDECNFLCEESSF